MKYQKRRIPILVVGMALLCNPLYLVAQQPINRTEPRTQIKPYSLTEEEALALLEEMAVWDENEGDYGIYGYMQRLSQVAQDLQSDRIVIGMLECPELHVNTTWGKVVALRPFMERKDVREYILNAMNHESEGIRAEAAIGLIMAGDWDLGIPVIIEQEAWGYFQQIHDDRVIPLLKEAVVTNSWQGRIRAAYVLFNVYNEPSFLPEVALDIILHAPTNTPDKDVIHAKYLAIQALGKFEPMDAAVPGLIRLAYDDAGAIVRMAIPALGSFKRIGNFEALKGLEKIANDHPDTKSRDLATSELTREK